jgi:hypothetical protein
MSRGAGPSFEQVNNGPAPSTLEILDELSSYDPEIAQRISLIQSGASPNGQHLNPDFNPRAAALTSEFVDEYRWALALTGHSWIDKGEKPKFVMQAAVEGLQLAAATHHEATEPDFLKHLSETVRDFLTSVFGPAKTRLPSPDELENFVIATRPAPTKIDLSSLVSMPEASTPVIDRASEEAAIEAEPNDQIVETETAANAEEIPEEVEIETDEDTAPAEENTSETEVEDEEDREESSGEILDVEALLESDTFNLTGEAADDEPNLEAKGPTATEVGEASVEDPKEEAMPAKKPEPVYTKTTLAPVFPARTQPSEIVASEEITHGDVAFADERTISTFQVGAQVLFLAMGTETLVEAEVSSIDSYGWTFKRPTPEDELTEEQRADRQRREVQIRERIRILKQDQAFATTEVIDENGNPEVHVFNHVKGFTDGRSEEGAADYADRRIEHELGRLHLALVPEFQEMVPHPHIGCIVLKDKKEAVVGITDLDKNTIIPMAAWTRMINDPEYVREWADHDPHNIPRQRGALLEAIKEAILAHRKSALLALAPATAPKSAGGRHVSTGASNRRVYAVLG